MYYLDVGTWMLDVGWLIGVILDIGYWILVDMWEFMWDMWDRGVLEVW